MGTVNEGRCLECRVQGLTGAVGAAEVWGEELQTLEAPQRPVPTSATRNPPAWVTEVLAELGTKA